MKNETLTQPAGPADSGKGETMSRDLSCEALAQQELSDLSEQLADTMQNALNGPHALEAQAQLLNYMLCAVTKNHLRRDIEGGHFSPEWINLALRIQKQCIDTVKACATIQYMDMLSTGQHYTNLRCLTTPAPPPPDFYERTEGSMKKKKKTKGWPAGPKPRRGKGWSPERRKAQAARAQARQPWRQSTGPRTEAGKQAAARNARAHGFRSREITELRALLRWQRNFVAVLLARHGR
jgi:hypothetical protein